MVHEGLCLRGCSQQVWTCTIIVIIAKALRDSGDGRASMLKGLADALMADYASSHKLDAIEEAISVYEQVLQFRPLGHKQRDEAVCDFGEALYAFCRFNGTDDSRAHRTLVLLREAVQLRPPNHPSRDRPLHSLARALLFIDYEQRSGNLAALTECILLNRECLQLRKVDHPGRADALSDLAVALLRSFERCGDPTLILESIDMNREALHLRKPGHPLHDASLNNLAMALRRLASLQGDLDALAESVSLLREVLELHPRGHPLRFYALGNLANSLHTRYQLQVLPAALSEAIALRREACQLFPASHPEWWRLITQLAESLVADFRHRRDGCSITEAITLLRQAVLLRPIGHDHRHLSLGNLAEALLAQFDEFRDIACLREAITLQREVLHLRTQGHMQRLEALHRLGHMLSRPESRSWPEALALFYEAVESCPAGHPSRSLLFSDMSKCFLDPSSPYFDLSKGIAHLSEGYSNELSHVNQRLGQAVSDLRVVETAYTGAIEDADAAAKACYTSQILDLHVQVIGLLPRAANFGVDHKTRLQVITGSDEIARNAAARALLLECTPQAVELMEEGRGIFWSQTLRLRSTGFDGIPDSDRENLLRMLRMLEHGARSAGCSEQTVAEREQALERRRQMNDEAEALISKIRSYPGCTRFLMPAAFDSLLGGLPDGVVIILNVSKLAHHAILLHKTAGIAAGLELESLSTSFDSAILRARFPRDATAQPAHKDEQRTRAMRLDIGRVSPFDHVLSQLWTSVVQPIICKLSLQVGDVRTRYHEKTEHLIESGRT
jgi:tetratricopeptide (TPR) repeat protein